MLFQNPPDGWAAIGVFITGKNERQPPKRSVTPDNCPPDKRVRDINIFCLFVSVRATPPGSSASLGKTFVAGKSQQLRNHHQPASISEKNYLLQIDMMNVMNAPILMAPPLTNYTIEMEWTGLAGWINYRESLLSLRFAYERMLTSIYIFVPGDEQWAAYCRSAGAKNATARRTEILERVATEVCNQHAPLAMVQVNDYGIELLF